MISQLADQESHPILPIHYDGSPLRDAPRIDGIDRIDRTDRIDRIDGMGAELCAYQEVCLIGPYVCL